MKMKKKSFLRIFPTVKSERFYSETQQVRIQIQKFFSEMLAKYIYIFCIRMSIGLAFVANSILESNEASHSNRKVSFVRSETQYLTSTMYTHSLQNYEKSTYRYDYVLAAATQLPLFVSLYNIIKRCDVAAPCSICVVLLFSPSRRRL